MARYISMSVSMPPEMADAIDREAEKAGMRASEYIRACIRSDDDEQLPVGSHDELARAIGDGKGSEV